MVFHETIFSGSWIYIVFLKDFQLLIQVILEKESCSLDHNNTVLVFQGKKKKTGLE